MAGETKKSGVLGRWWVRLTLYVLLIPYVTLALIVFFMQDRLLFYPEFTRVSDQKVEDAINRQGAEALVVEAGDGVELSGLFLPATPPEGAAGTQSGERRTLLYFGGNAETVEQSSGDYGRLRSHGWNVVLMAYRGYGNSEGEPSADALFADALGLYDAMASRQDVDAAGIATWGRSLGTGVATHVAANRPVIGVVLVSPFARLSEPAAKHYPWLPVKLLFKHEMDSLAVARNIATPALFYHGTDDAVIPYSQSQKLQEAWTPRPRLITLQGRGHDDVTMDPSYPDEAFEFLEGLR